MPDVPPGPDPAPTAPPRSRRVQSIVVLLPLWGLWGTPAGLLLLFLGVPGLVVAFLALVGSLLGLAAAAGLWHGEAWAERLGTVLCYVGVINVPVGTIVGGWTIHVLRNREHYEEVHQGGRERPA